MTKFIHVDQNINILTDEAAQEALQSENDKAFFVEKKGIIRVPVQRWELAQIAEGKHWMEKGLDISDDRNTEHYLGFDRYSVLRGRLFATGIELGCGPFTNLRIIADICQVSECTLLDPLIEDYLNHPNCAYTRTALSVENMRETLFLKRARTRLCRRFPVLRRWLQRPSSRTIPVCQILASPIEHMPTDRQYDLTILINVIEHCYEIQEIFTRILAIMKPGAVLVFHDVLYDHEKVKQSLRTHYDAAHPLQIDRQIVNRFLLDNFKPIYQNSKVCYYTFMGDDQSYETISFIGEKVQRPDSKID